MVREWKIFLMTAAVFVGLSVAVSAVPTSLPADHQPGPAGQGITGGQSKAVPTDIHDIRHPVQVGVNPAIYYWSAGAVAVLIIILAAWILIRRWKKKDRQNASDVTAMIYKSPEEEILAGLEALEKNRPGQPALFYFRLSALFRHYLQRRFNVDALEMTTEELLPHMSGLDFDRETLTGLKAFLKFGDQVKFARVMPESAEMTDHLNLMREMANRSIAAESTAETEGEM